MLPVAVDDEHEVAGRMPGAGLDRGAVALVVGMPDDAGAGLTRALTGRVR